MQLKTFAELNDIRLDKESIFLLKTFTDLFRLVESHTGERYWGKGVNNVLPFQNIQRWNA